MSLSFAVTFDYLCPFARNANEHIIDALQDGVEWDVSFTPYSLAQGHVEPGEADVWEADDPEQVAGLLAFQTGLAVRDHFPEHFLEVHRELFAARHDRGEDIKDRSVIHKALEVAGADPDAVFTVIDAGQPLSVLQHEHAVNAEDNGVWGVPTFIAGERAVFVRVLDRPEDDSDRARDRIERIVELVTGFPELHEFKQVDLPV